MTDPNVAEEWRPIVGYEGWYEVSNHGRVRSCARVVRRRRCGRVELVPVAAQLRVLLDDGRGYHHVRLSREGSRKYHRVHRLVLEAFVGPCPSGLITRHLDGVRNNNHISNLRWGTYSENAYDRVRHGNHLVSAKLTPDAVRDIRRGGAPDSVFARRYGVSRSTVMMARRGHTWANVR